MGKCLLLLAAVSVSQFLTQCWGEMDCWDYLVSGPQGVPDSAITASSHHESSGSWSHTPACGRLHMYREWSSSGCPSLNAGCWCSLRGDSKPHIQVKFSDPKKIVAMVLQQRQNYSSTLYNIRTYHVLYSMDGEDWDYVKTEGTTQVFNGPSDVQATKNLGKYQNIEPPFVAQYIRIRPLTWNDQTAAVCLRFDVMGCTRDTGRRRFGYLPLPSGSLSSSEEMDESHAEDLGECSLRCHRNITCRSFSYSHIHRRCKRFTVNKYTYLEPNAAQHTISDKQHLYYFDMTHVDLYMAIDQKTGLIYKVISRRYNKKDAMTACADFEMTLLVVNSFEKLDLVRRVKSSSLILQRTALRVNGGWYQVDGTHSWWDGGDPPRLLNLAPWNKELAPAKSECITFHNGNLQKHKCSSTSFAICEMLQT